MKQLTAAFVRSATLPGKYGDQHGLNRRVSPSDSKQWIWWGTMRPNRRDLGLGGYPYRSLAEARQMAFEYRKLAHGGGDPAALRRNTTAPSFAEACERVIEMRAPSLKDGGKSANNWRSTLERVADPRLGDMSIAEGHRPDDPTAAVMRALPRNGHQVQHHRALPHGEVAAALATVHASGACAATKLAFRFLVLTAARSGEVRGARWDEIDDGAKLWTVPAERAKSGRP